MITDKFKDIDTFIFDIDGVFTDGNLTITEDGHFLRTMSARDGLAVKMLASHKYTLGVITGGGSAGVKDRMKFLGIDHYYDNTWDKAAAMKEMFSNGVNPKTTLYIGDDIADIAIAGMVHILATPADGIPEIIEKADYVCAKKGGEGCVREIVEKVMKAKGQWPTF